MKTACLALASLLIVGCDDDTVDTEKEAEKAYLGLDLSVDKAIDLGFKGFSAVKSANIDPQTATGKEGGTLTIVGKVDQGSSDNKTMDLDVGMVGYTDDAKVIYDTPVDRALQPKISMKLAKIPTGTLSGTLVGAFTMSRDLEGTVTLTLSFTGDLEDPMDGTKVRRRLGTTHITGTATSSAGTYDVDVTR